MALENEDDVLFAELEEPTDLFILSVDLVAIDKDRKPRASGAMRKVKSPSKVESSSLEDKCDDDKMDDDDKTKGAAE